MFALALQVINGEKYAGEWKDGKYHGKGVLTAVNKDRYEGLFVDGSKCGEGVMMFANGDRYDGCWEKNVPHGKGVMNFANKDRFDGDWVFCSSVFVVGSCWLDFFFDLGKWVAQTRFDEV